jgi:hypothetical protein
MVGALVRGAGFLAALMLPSGVDEKVMFAVAPEVDTERTAGRSGASVEGEALAGGLEGTGGEEGEGVSKGVSESMSASGVDALEAIAEEESVVLPRVVWVREMVEAGLAVVRAAGEGGQMSLWLLGATVATIAVMCGMVEEIVAGSGGARAGDWWEAVTSTRVGTAKQAPDDFTMMPGSWTAR